MPKLFEQTEDTNPNTANRLSFGRAGVAALNITLANFLTWLNANLTFPAKDINTTIVETGDWDCSTDLDLVVPHGIVDFEKIRSVAVVIRDDSDTLRYPILTGGISGVLAQGSIISITPTSIGLRILSGGLFNSASFSSTSYVRGYIEITHIS